MNLYGNMYCIKLGVTYKIYNNHLYIIVTCEYGIFIDKLTQVFLAGEVIS